MKITILEEKGNKLIFEVEGATHTLCNMLRHELTSNADVKLAGYNVSHPYVGKPRFVVETKASANPRKAVQAAIKDLQKEIADVSKKGAKELK